MIHLLVYIALFLRTVCASSCTTGIHFHTPLSTPAVGTDGTVFKKPILVRHPILLCVSLFYATQETYSMLGADISFNPTQNQPFRNQQLVLPWTPNHIGVHFLVRCCSHHTKRGRGDISVIFYFTQPLLIQKHPAVVQFRIAPVTKRDCRGHQIACTRSCKLSTYLFHIRRTCIKKL